jgi:molybdenum cofactor synthesis domain-containing protein
VGNYILLLISFSLEISNMPDLKIGITVVGDEILSGHVQDTNTYWLLNQLRKMNYEVQRVEIVPDAVDLIARSVKRLLTEDFDLIFVTGGLGPTPHDMTTEGVACALGLKCETNAEALDLIRAQYERFRERGLFREQGSQDQAAAEKMSRLPPGCEILPPIGTAPGFYCVTKNAAGKDAKIFVLPGPPIEYQAMFKTHIKNKFLQSNPDAKTTIEIATQTEESRLVPLIERIAREFPTVRIASYPNIEQLQVLIRVTGKPEATNYVADLIQKALKDLGPG